MNLPLFAIGILRGHWKLIATLALFLIPIAGWWRSDSLRAGYKADLANVRQEYALFREAVTARSGEALAAQKAVNADQEQKWKDKANAADQSIDDLRDRLRVALLQSQGSGGSQGRPASAATQGHDTGVSQGVPAAATGDSGSMPVNIDIMAGLSSYALQCRSWALSLENPASPPQ